MKFKKEIATLLIASTLLTSSLVACNTSQNDQTNTDGTTVETTTLQDQTTNTSPQEQTVFLNYQDILDTISLVSVLGGKEKFAAQHPLMNEREQEIFSHLPDFVCGALGYCIKDINKDGIEELVLLTENWQFRGLFTMHSGYPIFLEECKEGAIGKDGKIRILESEWVPDGTHTVYRLKSLINGQLVTELEFGLIDYWDMFKWDEGYQLVNGEREKKGTYDISEMISIHSFNNLNYVMIDAGITCTRLLDIPAPYKSGDNYNITSLKKPGSDYERTYFYEIYDTYGKVVLSGQSDDFYIYETKTPTEDTVLEIYDGDGFFFYSVRQNLFSQKFKRGENYSNSGEKIAYFKGEGEERRLVVQDIFDTAVFYREYEHESCETEYVDMRFSQDGKSITLQYHLLGNANKTTSVLCFETLPILKTKKICYIRLGSSIDSDPIYVSSGVRAVLRADTNDTVRLLSTIPVTGGEYESDGEVRNDWYMIDYKGRTCYVSADSFEIATYVVEE